MSNPQSVQPSIDAAMNGSIPTDIVADVKNIVAHEIEQLSPGIDIKYTDYFNHTYMPDMILTWGGRKTEERPVFLRNSLRLESTLFDVRGLKDRAPVVLGLRQVDPSVEIMVRESSTETQRVFVTDVASIDQAGQSSPGASNTSAPLLSIVRSNLLRTGRGIMTTTDATALVSATEQVAASDPVIATDAFVRFEALTDSLLAEDGAYQVSRAGRLIRAIQSPSLLAEFTETATGRLSETDLSILLPVLLNRDDAERLGTDLWSAVARLVELEDLESLPSIDGLDVSPLAESAVSEWQATRVELVLNNEFDPDVATGVEYASTKWHIRGGKLMATIGPWNLVFVSDDKRRLRGASDSREANWAEIASVAGAMIVESATLRGIVRRLTIDAEQSSNVVRDIERITSTLDDSYRVQQLVVRLPGSDGAGVEVDFQKMLSTVQTGTVPVDELGSIAVRLLGHRSAVEPTWLR